MLILNSFIINFNYFFICSIIIFLDYFKHSDPLNLFNYSLSQLTVFSMCAFGFDRKYRLKLAVSFVEYVLESEFFLAIYKVFIVAGINSDEACLVLIANDVFFGCSERSKSSFFDR